jgi:hypothetical protein
VASLAWPVRCDAREGDDEEEEGARRRHHTHAGREVEGATRREEGKKPFFSSDALGREKPRRLQTDTVDNEGVNKDRKLRIEWLNFLLLSWPTWLLGFAFRIKKVNS